MQLPSAKFNYFDDEGNMREITTEELCEGKKASTLAVRTTFGDPYLLCWHLSSAVALI